jgi:uncharacterized membrane protein YvbJ
MTYCHNCGEKLPEEAYFCPKCGAKTAAGAKVNAPYPSDEIREAFTRMSVEVEKAFTIAAKEVHNAFQTARSNMQSAGSKGNVVCPSCGEKNSASAAFCFKCGKGMSASQPKSGETA